MEKKNIYESLNLAMKEIGAVAKKDKNTFDNYKFRGIDAVMNALQPALKSAGITIVPTVIDHIREDRLSKKGEPMIYTVLTVKYTFYALDGSSVEAVVIGEAMDRSDKSTNKAMSAAFKYAAFQVLCIPTEEMIDSEKESLEMLQKELTPLSDREANVIKTLLEETESDVTAFLKYFDAPSVDEMKQSQYGKALQMLSKKKEANNA